MHDPKCSRQQLKLLWRVQFNSLTGNDVGEDQSILLHFGFFQEFVIFYLFLVSGGGNGYIQGIGNEFAYIGSIQLRIHPFFLGGIVHIQKLYFAVIGKLGAKSKEVLEDAHRFVTR